MQDRGSKMDTIAVANPPFSLALPLVQQSAGGAVARRLSTFGQNCQSRSRSRSVGERQWGRVRAVMAMYTRLRQIKRREPESSISNRSKSSQRWLKLRTTVQLTGVMAAASTQKRSNSSLKREDSFIQRFSTRQLPEIQETFDADDGGSSSGGGGGGGLGDDSCKSGEEGRRRKRRPKRKRPPRSVLNPDENALFYWLAFLSLWVLYNLWTVIVRLAFPELHRNEYESFAWNVCDALGDAAYILDIVVQFRTGYLEQGIMVHDSRKLAIHYLRSRAFLLDLSSLLPIDWLLLPQHKFDPHLARWRPALRIVRVLKLYRVFAFYYVVESRTVYPNAWRVVNLVHILLLLAHWFGCFYFLLSESEGFRSDWSYPYPEGDFATLSRKYLGSLYWSTLTLTTIGDLPTPETNAERPRRPYAPTAPPLTTTTATTSSTSTSTASSQQLSRSTPISNPTAAAAAYQRLVVQHGPTWCQNTSRSEHARGFHQGFRPLPRRGLRSRLLHHSSNQGYIFTIASYLIGVFIFATIVGQVGNVITNRNASRLEFERLLDTAKLYMRHHKVPRSMQRRVQRWYDYSWSRGRIQGGGDSSSALRILPDKLKTELALHVNLATLKKVSIFQECQPEFLHDLVLKMRASIFTPGDMICRRGEVAREMFIIADGVLEVISETGKVLTTMKSGDFFGEIGILNLDGLNKRTADVRSVGYADLFSLSRDDVLNAMKDYPEAEDLLLSLGRKRLAEARKAASAHRAAMARKGLLALERQAQRNAQNTEESVSSRLTNRIRSDVNSLRNAFRKSFKDGSNSSSKRSPSPEKLEMGVYGHASRSGLRGNKLRVSPNSPSSSGGRHGLLRRMDRVPSEDVNNRRAEERAARQPLLAKRGHSQPEVIGAGLPLFERLKLLKRREEEQERLEKEQQELEQKQRQEQQEKEEQQQKQQQQQQQQNEAEPEHEVIGAGLPLFERLKLLKQREMEKREQERREQERRDELATAVSAPVTVEREERPVRHISFSETPSTPPSAKKSGRLELRRADTTGSSRWTLAALPKAFGSKLKPPLDSIQSASFNDDSTELAPETEPLRRTSRSESVGGTCRSQRELSPPPPSAMKNSRRRGSSFVRKPKLTIADYKMGSSMQMPYQRIRTTESPPMAPSSGAKKTFSSIVRLPNKQNRYSRQNTIQVVSDVETVLTDILREVIPGRTKLTPNEQPPTHPSIQPVIQPARQSVQQSASSSVPNPVTRPIIHPATHPTTHLVIHSAPHPAVHPTTHTITHTTTHTTSLTTTHIAHSPAHTAHTAKYPMPHPIMPTVESDLRSPGHVRITENPACSLHQSCDSSMVCSGVPRPQRLRLRQLKDRTSRDYRSIDDLSPEYTCLPFVKRLKILNERQKIAELQRALTVVQSTDSGDNEKEEESAQSASRPTALVVAPPAAPPSASSNAPAAPLSAASASPAADGETKKPPTPRVSSHEGNETPERVNLKKMLRSMSGMDLLPNLDQHHRMRLLRSQTVEGYALRHASFTHSSFRNKNWRQGMAQTLPSPPTDIPVYDDIRSRTTDGDYSHVTTFTTLVKSTRKAPVESTTESAADTGDESSARKKKSRACKEVIKEECISELLVAIKHVLQERLQEIQSQFQAQIAQLQTEVDQRDEEISRLRQQLDDRHPSAGDSESEPQPEEPPTRPDSPDQRGVSEDADDEDDSCYFARTFSRDSVVAKSPTSPAEERKSPSTIDELLEADGEEQRLPEAINPEPLWQLEFGSCWERIRDSSVTSNPRDAVLDMGDEDDATGGRSSSCSTSSTRSNSLDRHTSKKRRKMFRSLSLGKARKESKDGKESRDGKESKNPYIPDWEVMMLAESLEGRSQVDEPAGQRQRAPLKTSTSVEPKPRSARLTRNKSLPVSQHYVERK